MNNKADKIFVVGSGRSGTTLLRNILDLHKDIAIVPELQFFNQVYSKRKRYGDISNVDQRKKFVDQIIKTISSSGDPYYKSHAMDYASLRQELMNCETYLEAYTFLLSAFASKKEYKILVEKTPTNIFFLDTIIKLFPSAKFIHIVRDGREVVASARKRGWGKDIIGPVVLWREAVRALIKFRAKHEDKVLEIKYEELINNPKEEINKIIKFLELPEINNEFIEKLKTLTSFSSFFEHKQSGLYQSKNFSTYFSEEEKGIINLLIHKELALLGYKPGKVNYSLIYLIKLYKETIKFRINFTLRKHGYIGVYNKIKNYIKN